MKVIFALGNPGKDYNGTRHNVGFMIAEALATEFDGRFNSSRFHAEVAEATSEVQKLIIARPTTFYNLVGSSARSLADFYKLDSSRDLLIVHDDLALPMGTLRIREAGQDAGNNGIKSINEHLGAAYLRLRIGIDNDQRQVMGDTAFVLGRFDQDEQKMLSDIIVPKALDIIRDFLGDKTEPTTHKLL